MSLTTNGSKMAQVLKATVKTGYVHSSKYPTLKQLTCVNQ